MTPANKSVCRRRYLSAGQFYGTPSFAPVLQLSDQTQPCKAAFPGGYILRRAGKGSVAPALADSLRGDRRHDATGCGVVVRQGHRRSVSADSGPAGDLVAGAVPLRGQLRDGRSVDEVAGIGSEAQHGCSSELLRRALTAKRRLVNVGMARRIPSTEWRAGGTRHEELSRTAVRVA